ncbi:MAG TPA: hypothetical protein VI297_06310 [Gemmatimonadales bacterium]
MTCIWRSLPLLALAWSGPAAAQGVREAGVQALVTTASPALGTAGLYAAVRPSLRTRIAVSVGGGVSDGRAAGRAELLAHFLLSPTTTARPGVYLGAGVAGVAGPVDQGYVVVLVGVEAAPAGRSGWALETGVGGGLRLTVGWRWRWRGRKAGQQ